MEEDPRNPDGMPIFDTLDIDLLVKVMMHTIFSPFFVFMIPVFYFFQGAGLTDPVIIGCGVYYFSLSVFWAVRWYSRLYRNQGSIFFAPRALDWGEQVVVITGGASGVGELLANTLAVRNVNVVVLDVKPIVTENYNITYYKCDVSSWEEVQTAAKKIEEEIGQPSILINNAGVVQGKLILDLSPEDVKQTFGVNVLSHYWTLKAFLPGMIEKKSGHVVTVSSVLGITGAAQMTDYSASKAALNLLHESLRYELDNRYKSPQIRTTLVAPGHLQTTLFARASFSQSPIFKFFMPTISPVVVVKKIITALDDQHSQTIYLPFYVNFAPYIQHLPSFARDFFQWVTGADFVMQDFVKLSGLRADEQSKKGE